MKTKEEQAAEIAISKTVAAMKRQGHSFDKIAKELAIIAYSDIADYMKVSEGGAIEAIPLDSLTKNKSRAVKKIKEKTTIKESLDGDSIFKESNLEYEFYDKPKALEFAASLMGMETVPQKVLLGVEGSLMAAVTARLGDGTDAKPKN